MKTLIIGFSGHIGSGKNYIAEELFIPLLINKLIEKTNYNIIPYYYSFGDQVKVELLCRMSYEEIDSKNGYNEFFINKNTDVRKKLQEYATENGRDKYHKNIWVRALDIWINIQTERLSKLKQKNICQLFIITDVRFKNELEYIESNDGIVIRIIAPNRSINKIIKETNNDNNIIKEIVTHQSENELDFHEFKYIIDNDDNIKLTEKINKLCDEIIIGLTEK